LNEGIQHATGEYIARMDADDVAFKNRFQLQLEYLKKHPEVDLVAGKIAVIGKNHELLGVRRPPEQHQEIVSNPIRGFPMAHPAFMGKVAWFRQFAYKQRIKCEDQDLLLRAMTSSCYANLQEFVLAYRETAIEPFKYREGRLNYIKALNDYYFKQTLYTSQLLMKCRNALAFYRDWVALKTGLGYKLLPNRHLPPNSSEIEAWETERKNLASI
jgi:glycosyltransferase involved in cell wall biosynthesis